MCVLWVGAVCVCMGGIMDVATQISSNLAVCV